VPDSSPDRDGSRGIARLELIGKEGVDNVTDAHKALGKDV